MGNCEGWGYYEIYPSYQIRNQKSAVALAAAYSSGNHKYLRSAL